MAACCTTGSSFIRDVIYMSMAPDYAIGWGTLAIINAGIAQGKNRSGFNWFLISIFLGPIATLIRVAFCDNRKRSGD